MADTLPAVPTPEPGPLPAIACFDLYEMIMSGRAARTARAYESDFKDFARFVSAPSPAAALDRLTALPQGTANACALAYRAHLTARGLSPATVARRLAALRSAVKLARTLGRVGWTLDVDPPRVRSYRDTRGPGADGWRALLERARSEATTPKGRRDLALVRLLHDLALRRGEAVGLDVEHFDRDAGTVAVLGKGQAARTRLTLPGPTRQALAAWLADRGEQPGPLFVRLDRGARGVPGRLTGRNVARVVGALGRRAGLARAVKPHGLRHCAITEVLDLTGGDVRAAAKFSRHARLETLLVYDDSRRDVAGELARRLAGDGG